MLPSKPFMLNNLLKGVLSLVFHCDILQEQPGKEILNVVFSEWNAVGASCLTAAKKKDKRHVSVSYTCSRKWSKGKKTSLCIVVL